MVLISTLGSFVGGRGDCGSSGARFTWLPSGEDSRWNHIRAESPTQGPLRHNEPTSGDGGSYEQVKIEVAADLAQLVLDITGILDPTPLSDGTNALISLARGRWTGGRRAGRPPNQSPRRRVAEKQ